jgi:Flp pilus assembly protein TadG
MKKRRTNRGNAMVEFVMATIPTLFCLMGVVEISRIMYSYDSMANAVRLTARYAVVHGLDCTQGSNTCSTTVGSIAQYMVNAGPALPASSISLTLTSTSGSTTCVLSACLTNTTAWPSGTSATPGNAITVSATAPMKTTLTMFVPGSGVTRFTNPNIQASSKQVIQF